MSRPKFKRCVDCKRNRSWLNSFKPRHAACRSHDKFDRNCGPCVKTLVGPRQPRCNDCDRQRDKRGPAKREKAAARERAFQEKVKEAAAQQAKTNLVLLIVLGGLECK